MNDPARLTDTEWEIMRVVWAQHPITASEIIRRLAAGEPTWHPKTARALLGRLVCKKALGFEPEGRLYLYRPLVTERECVAVASESFLDRVFGGSLKPMLAHFVEARRIRREDLRELNELLEGQPKQEAGARKERKSRRL
jgi:BlaI family transcriptional regulator, penicillinase repressor